MPENTHTCDLEKMVVEAEKKIARVLAELETNTGMVVDYLELNDIDVTTVGDDRPQLIRSLNIKMKRLPGTKWDIG